jgi:hypothetical protein
LKVIKDNFASKGRVKQHQVSSHLPHQVEKIKNHKRKQERKNSCQKFYLWLLLSAKLNKKTRVSFRFFIFGAPFSGKSIKHFLNF